MSLHFLTANKNNKYKYALTPTHFPFYTPTHTCVCVRVCVRAPLCVCVCVKQASEGRNIYYAAFHPAVYYLSCQRPSGMLA